MLEKLSRNPTIASALQWYESQTPRDQLIVKCVALFVVLVILYLSTWAPAKSYMDDGVRALESRKDLLALVQENRTTLKRMAQSSASSAPTLDSQQLVSSVTNLAKRSGLSLKRFEPSGENQVKVWVDEASFDKLVSWLGALKKSLNVSVDQISLEVEDEPGRISARLTLRS